MNLFTVDRAGSFKEGHVCELSQISNIAPEYLRCFASDLCPNGLSQHGNYYLVSSNLDEASSLNSHTEMLFEWVRRARYPDRPSRFQSMFAVGDIDSAIRFMSIYGSRNQAVYELSSLGAFRADMRLITYPRQTAILSSYFAELYWQGLPWHEGEPTWEWIVPCPVTIGRRVM